MQNKITSPLMLSFVKAGDFVKFGFTMASTTTLLAWGCLSYKDAYVAAGE